MQEAGVSVHTEPADAEITFDSENISEKFTVNLSDILFVRSANNYIEIISVFNETLRKQLIRSTLKHAEEILQPHSNIFRCHRTILVNTDFVIQLAGIPGNLKLKLRKTEEEIPVSRQYLQIVKNALNRRKGK